MFDDRVEHEFRVGCTSWGVEVLLQRPATSLQRTLTLDSESCSQLGQAFWFRVPAPLTLHHTTSSLLLSSATVAYGLKS